MGTYTTNLNLYNTDMDNDGNDLFDFDRDINANNNILDGAIGKPSTLTTTAKTSLVAAINEVVSNCGALTNLNTTAKNNLVAAINEIFSSLADFASKDLDNLSTTGQGIIDAKIEAEALTAQNGYIKFKLNGISNILLWGKSSGSSCTFPISFTQPYIALITISTSGNTATYRAVTGLLNTGITLTSGTSFDWYYIAIGI